MTVVTAAAMRAARVWSARVTAGIHVRGIVVDMQRIKMYVHGIMVYMQGIMMHVQGIELMMVVVVKRVANRG